MTLRPEADLREDLARVERLLKECGEVPDTDPMARFRNHLKGERDVLLWMLSQVTRDKED